jgi:hypothetical protein
VPAPQPVTPTPAQPAPTDVALNEVAAIPVDGRVLIALHEPPAGVELIVRLTDTEQNAAVEAAATPTARLGAVDLTSIGGDRIVVTLPRSIVSGRITVDGELLVHREGETFTALPPDHTVRGEEIVITLAR